MDLIDVVRPLNVVLSAWLMWVCMMRVVRDWPHWNRRERVVRVHLTAYLFVIAYGTIEAIGTGAPPGSRVVLVLAVHASFAGWLWATRHDPVTVPERVPVDG